MFSFLTIRVWWWIAGGLAVALAAAVLAFYVRGGQLQRAKADLEEAKADVRQAKVTIAGYQDAVKQCNENTRKLEQASREKQAQADQELAKARADAKKHQPATQRRADALSAPTPAGKGCKDALTDVRKDLK